MAKITNVRLPNGATPEYSQEQTNQLIRSLEQVILTLNTNYTPIVTEQTDQAMTWFEASGSLPGSQGGQMLSMPYGSFYDTTTQTAAVINTAYLMKFNTTALAYQMYIDPATTSRLYVDVAGVYNFQFSAQTHKTAGAQAYYYMWCRINGTDVPQSAGKVSIQGTSAEAIAAWNYVLDLNGGDYFEMAWSADDTRCQLLAGAAVAPYPAIPSVILTATYVSSLV